MQSIIRSFILLQKSRYSINLPIYIDTVLFNNIKQQLHIWDCGYHGINLLIVAGICQRKLRCRYNSCLGAGIG
jgi:hypothetical protein